MPKITRRAAVGLLAAGGGLLGLGLGGGYLLRVAIDWFHESIGHAGDGSMMGGATSGDMNAYMDLFDRHTEIRRSVQEIPGGVQTTTESDSPDLTALLQAHVSSMYAHLNQGAEVTCMSPSLPTLFLNANAYKRQLTFSAKGVVVTETSSDPEITRLIREHAQEVTGFVQDGMPSMMQGMMTSGT
jgi:hypothetical protein